jgi:hypothetical protein
MAAWCEGYSQAIQSARGLGSLLFLLQQTIEIGIARMPLFMDHFAKIDRSVLLSILL